MTANLQINCKEVVNMHNGNCQSSCSQPSRQRFCIYYRHYITYTVFNRSQWTHKMPNLMFNALLMYVVQRYIETPQNYKNYALVEKLKASSTSNPFSCFEMSTVASFGKHGLLLENINIPLFSSFSFEVSADSSSL
jgi:hypothetical protein